MLFNRSGCTLLSRHAYSVLRKNAKLEDLRHAQLNLEPTVDPSRKGNQNNSRYLLDYARALLHNPLWSSSELLKPIVVLRRVTTLANAPPSHRFEAHQCWAQ
jgi:hypothetical protein